MHLGLSRALKTVHWTVFVRRDVPPAYDLRLPHRPAPFGRGLSSATAAPALALCFRRRRWSPPQQAILVPNGAQTAVPSKTYNKKYPAASCEVLCGAPSGTRTQDPLIKSQLLSLVACTHGLPFFLLVGQPLCVNALRSVRLSPFTPLA